MRSPAAGGGCLFHLGHSRESASAPGFRATATAGGAAFFPLGTQLGARLWRKGESLRLPRSWAFSSGFCSSGPRKASGSVGTRPCWEGSGRPAWTWSLSGPRGSGTTSRGEAGHPPECLGSFSLSLGLLVLLLRGGFERPCGCSGLSCPAEGKRVQLSCHSQLWRVTDSSGAPCAPQGCSASLESVCQGVTVCLGENWVVT